MLSKAELWKRIEEIARERELEIFDVEMPANETGFLKIYLERRRPPEAKAAENNEASNAGVNVGDCTWLSKRILNREDVEEILPGEMRLEVSSPGINRKLSRPEHFKGAIGERVKISTFGKQSEEKFYAGVLQKFDGTNLEVMKDSEKSTVSIPLEDVRKARVDFVF